MMKNAYASAPFDYDNSFTIDCLFHDAILKICSPAR